MRSEDWDAKFAASEFLFTDRPNQTLAVEVEALPPGRALDLGAGQGRNAVWLAERGWRVTAVDFSPVGLRRGEQLARAKGVEVEFVLADVREWRPRETFDLVVVAYLQLPAAELRAVLATATTALATGGTLLIIGHDRDNLVRGHGGPQDSDVLYTIDEVTAALDGLRIEKAEQIDRVVDSDIGPLKTVDTLVRASAVAEPRA